MGGRGRGEGNTSLCFISYNIQKVQTQVYLVTVSTDAGAWQASSDHIKHKKARKLGYIHNYILEITFVQTNVGDV